MPSGIPRFCKSRKDGATGHCAVQVSHAVAAAGGGVLAPGVRVQRVPPLPSTRVIALVMAPSMRSHNDRRHWPASHATCAERFHLASHYGRLAFIWVPPTTWYPARHGTLEHQRMSQAEISSTPAPMHGPWIAATTHLPQAATLLREFCHCSPMYRMCNAFSAADDISDRFGPNESRPPEARSSPVRRPQSAPGGALPQPQHEAIMRHATQGSGRPTCCESTSRATENDDPALSIELNAREELVKPAVDPINRQMQC